MDHLSRCELSRSLGISFITLAGLMTHVLVNMSVNTRTRIVWENTLKQARCIKAQSRKAILLILIITIFAWTVSQIPNWPYNTHVHSERDDVIQGEVISSPSPYSWNIAEINKKQPNDKYKYGDTTATAPQEKETSLHTVTRLILLTYMRSGSTFTSELFQTHPDVFFMFEPFHTTWYYKPKIIPYLHKYKRIYFENLEMFLADVKIDTLDKILKCQFKNVDILTLIQEHWHHSITTRAYKLCTVEGIGVAGIEKCLPLLTDACSRAKVNFLKTINLTIHQAEPFIDKDPNLKLIYLVRDPRAVLWSQMRYGEFAPSAINSYSKTFCGIMLNDIQEYGKLKTTHPNQVTFVRYEDIAHKPLRLTEDLYNFVGLPLTQNITKHIHNMTTNGNDEDCALCISKSNSAQAAEKWRLQATDNFVQIVDENCNNVYQYIGYLPIQNASSLRDMNVPVRTAPSPDLML